MMRRVVRRLVIALGAVAVVATGSATATDQGFSSFAVAPGTEAMSRASLVAIADDDGAYWVAVRIRLKDGWHTYWRNPGDSGAPSVITWHLPQGFAVGDVRWPAPELFRVGPIVNFGYEHEAWLVSRLEVPAAPDGDTTVRADAQWLVCAEICIPQSASLSLDLAATPADGANALQQVVDTLPAPLPGVVSASAESDRIQLTSAPAPGGSDAGANLHFFPDAFGVIDYAADQDAQFADGRLTLSLRRDPSTDALPDRLAGVLVVRGPASVRAYDVSTPLVATGEQ